MNILLTILYLLFWAVSANAQFNASLRTDRPGQAICPYTVGKFVFQTQTGINLGGFNEEQLNYSGKYIAPSTVFRFGLTNRVEINTGYEYQSNKYNTAGISSSANGLSLNLIGSRISLVDAKGWLPAIALQVTAKLPVSSPATDAPNIAPTILISANKNLSDQFSLLLNGGIDYTGSSPSPNGVYMVNLGFTVTDKLSTYIESYGTFAPSSFEIRYDGGIGYLLNDNFQLDLYGGIGSNKNRFDYFTSIGFTWRVVALHK